MKKKSLYTRLITLGVTLGLCTSLLEGCGVRELKDFAEYAKAVEQLVIPEEVTVVALGEATHGNKEFQELKLQVFAHLVENTEVRGFALEADFAGCAVANDYILHEKGDAQNAVKKLGFELYRTDEMLALVEWMHAYNQKAEPAEKVRFYGFDMQRSMPAISRLKEFYHVVAEDKAGNYSAKLDEFYGTEEFSVDKADISDIRALLQEMCEDMETNAESYIAATDEMTHAYALQSAVCLLQNLELQNAGMNYSEIRDKYMTENVEWILNREESIHGKKLMLSGHNGHVARVVNSSYTNMGYYLAQELTEEYFVIGTDFYHTTCNIATKDARQDYELCSDDPLAKAVGDMEENIYYLDFSEAENSTELAELINNKMKTGSLGESYSPLMKFVKSLYQINIAPRALYDGMIFVYEATPIRVWEYQ